MPVKPMDLKDKVAIVTGASRGIGKAIALGLAGEGVKVVVAARSESPRPGLPGTIHATVEAIQAIGGTALAVVCNVREEESILAMVRQTMDAFGRVDVLVNNAGIGSYRSLLESSVKEWDLVMDIDLRAPFICCQAVVPHMIDHGGGSIINVSSYAAGNIFSSTQSAGPDGGQVLIGQAYGTAKAGLERFTWGLAAELGQYNIAVNALKPLGPVLTEGFQAQRPDADFSTWPTPEAMAKAAVFLARQDATGLSGAIVTDEEIVKRLGL
jgi:NAD(P)-dependent dehydrogenase (short-subunit alcohol dehydrogenase family)